MIYALFHRDYDECGHVGYVAGPDDADMAVLFAAFRARYGVPLYRFADYDAWRAQEDASIVAMACDGLCDPVPGDDPDWQRYYAPRRPGAPALVMDGEVITSGCIVMRPDDLFPDWLVRDHGFVWATVTDYNVPWKAEGA